MAPGEVPQKFPGAKDARLEGDSIYGFDAANETLRNSKTHL
jgi:hypothetical protein